MCFLLLPFLAFICILFSTLFCVQKKTSKEKRSRIFRPIFYYSIVNYHIITFQRHSRLLSKQVASHFSYNRQDSPRRKLAWTPRSSLSTQPRLQHLMWPEPFRSYRGSYLRPNNDYGNIQFYIRF